jgi:DNA polymerase III subunit chi
MTERVDFYVLNGASPQQRWNFACRLTAKAYLQDLSVIICCENADDARVCDDMLWTFNDRSFVPHDFSLAGDSPDRHTPVHLRVDLGSAETADLLVNLADRMPGGWERFTRIAEIIDADPERRRLGRERFRVYRERKLALQTHQLADAAEI